MKLAERMSRIGTESAFEVLARARALEAQGKSIIHLEIGQPDFPTPLHIKAAGKKAIDDGWTGYGPTGGFPEFRDAIAEYISRTRRITVSGANVCVVPGGKPIMYFLMTALLEPGDEVIYPNPGFPIYESLVDFLGATRVPMPLVEERGFSFDLATFESELADEASLRHHVFHRYAQLLQARNASSAFHPHGGQRVLDCGESIFTLLRLSPDGSQRVLCLHNISDKPQSAAFNLKDVFDSSSGQLIDLITNQAINDPLNGHLVLHPYQTLWLRTKE